MKYVFCFLIFWSCSNPESGTVSMEKKYFPSGKLMEKRQVINGVRHGWQTAYWENGRKRFEYRAVNDAYEGELKEWAENGQLFHVAHYKNGQEDGLQQMWHPNGAIRSNYVIIQGRRFGLLGTKNCKNINEKLLAN